MIVKSSDVIVVGYTSLAQGGLINATFYPPLHYPLYQRLKAFYGSRCPHVVNVGVGGQSIAQWLAAPYSASMSTNPDILIIDGTPNDIGVSQATLNNLWSAIANPSNYSGGILPRHVCWVSTIWRGSEAVGDASLIQIAADDALAKATAAANASNFSGGTSYADAAALWAAEVGANNPKNFGQGVYTVDGTHQKYLGADLKSRAVFNLMQLT